MENKKAKRRLSDFDFSKKGCHVSLVGSSVGGPANGRTILLAKSLEQGNNKEDEMEMIEKSAVEALVQKAVEEAVMPVQKALDEAQAVIKAYEEKEAQAFEKARRDRLASVIGAENVEFEKQFEILKAVSDEVFDLVIKSKEEANKALEKEVGVSTKEQDEEGSVSLEMKMLQKKYKK